MLRPPFTCSDQITSMTWAWTSEDGSSWRTLTRASGHGAPPSYWVGAPGLLEQEWSAPLQPPGGRKGRAPPAGWRGLPTSCRDALVAPDAGAWLRKVWRQRKDRPPAMPVPWGDSASRAPPRWAVPAAGWAGEGSRSGKWWGGGSEAIALFGVHGQPPVRALRPPAANTSGSDSTGIPTTVDPKMPR